MNRGGQKPGKSPSFVGDHEQARRDTHRRTNIEIWSSLALYNYIFIYTIDN